MFDNSFNEHGVSCKGHANSMAACLFDKAEDRALMVSILDYYINREAHAAQA